MWQALIQPLMEMAGKSFRQSENESATMRSQLMGGQQPQQQESPALQKFASQNGLTDLLKRKQAQEAAAPVAADPVQPQSPVQAMPRQPESMPMLPKSNGRIMQTLPRYLQ